MEGRWLRNASYLDSYSRFWLQPHIGKRDDAPARKYTFWAASAMHARFLVTGDAQLIRSLYRPLAANYDAWVATHFSREHGCFWQYADRDGQEHSIGGDGCRPLLNAVMYGEAAALAAIAGVAGDFEGTSRYQSDAAQWRSALLALWSSDLDFFVTRAVPRPESVPRRRWTEQQQQAARRLNRGRCPPQWPIGDLVTSRELQGLSTPWYFGAVPPADASRYAASWSRLFDRSGGFGAEWGPRTAERSDACYNYTARHECLWNAPTWPFETSKAISGALTFLRDYPPAAHASPGAIDGLGLWTLLAQYARLHTHASAVNSTAWLLAGLGRAWIGEAYHADEGYDLPRAHMYEAGSPHRNRGHRYLHSTFCDLVIGLLGVHPSIHDAAKPPDGTGGGGSIVVQPLLPKELGARYFAIDGLRLRGRDVSVAFDANGLRYGLGPGVHVLVDGILAKSGVLGERLVVDL